MEISIIGRGTYTSIAENLTSLRQTMENNFIENKNEIKDENFTDDMQNTDIASIMGNTKYNRISPISKYAVKASAESIADANLTKSYESGQVGIFFGTTEGPEYLSHSFWSLLKKSAYKKANPLLFPETSTNIPASYVNIAHNISGPTITNVSGATTGHEIVEIAANYLEYGLIKYAVVINAEEQCDFVSWRRQKEIIENSSKNAEHNYTQTDNDLLRSGANCLLLTKSQKGKNNWSIVSNYVVTDVKPETAIDNAINAALDEAQLKHSDIDLIIHQNTNNDYPGTTIEKLIKKSFSEKVPLLNLQSIMGEKYRKCLLMNIICSTIFSENRLMLKNAICKENNRSMTDTEANKITNILFITLPHTGVCGVTIVRV